MHLKNSLPALAAGLILVAGGVEAQQLPRCDLYAVEGVTQQQTADGPFVGELTLTNLLTGQMSTVISKTMVLGFLDAEQAVTSHDMDSNDGNGIHITTFDDSRLIMSGPTTSALMSRLEVETGHGRYNCGEVAFSAPSQIDFAAPGGPQASLKGMAKLCKCRPADN